MPQERRQANVRSRMELREPHKWAVLFWNDDFTTMEFVVEVLHDVFFKTAAEAEQLMLRVHGEGQAVVGVYTYDVAVSRANTTVALARQAGFPLKVTYREV